MKLANGWVMNPRMTSLLDEPGERRGVIPTMGERTGVSPTIGQRRGVSPTITYSNRQSLVRN